MQFWAPDDGRKTRPKHVERLTEIKKLWNFASYRLYSENTSWINYGTRGDDGRRYEKAPPHPHPPPDEYKRVSPQHLTGKIAIDVRTKIGKAAAVTALLFVHTNRFSRPPLVALAVPSLRNRPLLSALVIWARISSTQHQADSLLFFASQLVCSSSRNMQLCIYKSWINYANRTNLT